MNIRPASYAAAGIYILFCAWSYVGLPARLHISMVNRSYLPHFRCCACSSWLLFRRTAPCGCELVRALLRAAAAAHLYRAHLATLRGTTLFDISGPRRVWASAVGAFCTQRLRA
jgi:hypothetical protein